MRGKQGEEKVESRGSGNLEDALKVWNTKICLLSSFREVWRLCKSQNLWLNFMFIAHVKLIENHLSCPRAGEEPKGLIHPRQVLYHWATFSVQEWSGFFFFFVCSFYFVLFCMCCTHVCLLSLTAVPSWCFYSSIICERNQKSEQVTGPKA